LALRAKVTRQKGIAHRVSLRLGCFLGFLCLKSFHALLCRVFGTGIRGLCGAPLCRWLPQFRPISFQPTHLPSGARNPGPPRVPQVACADVDKAHVTIPAVATIRVNNDINGLPSARTLWNITRSCRISPRLGDNSCRDAKLTRSPFASPPLRRRRNPKNRYYWQCGRDYLHVASRRAFISSRCVHPSTAMVKVVMLITAL